MSVSALETVDNLCINLADFFHTDYPQKYAWLL